MTSSCNDTVADALSAIVVAHPDDEALWLSGVLASADRVVLCFGDQFGRPKSSLARRRAVAAVPLTGLVNLAVPESGAGFSVDWNAPRLTQAGVAITDVEANRRYETNYARLVEQLVETLQGCGDVYTHNPWGEYGHAEHIQVHRAVAALQAELGFTLWWSNYVGPRTRGLAAQIGREPCWTRQRTVPVDRVLAHRLMRVYQRHGAWTWSRFHRWPPQETLYTSTPMEPRHSLAGERLLDVSRLKWWRPWRSALWRVD